MHPVELAPLDAASLKSAVQSACEAFAQSDHGRRLKVTAVVMVADKTTKRRDRFTVVAKGDGSKTIRGGHGQRIGLTPERVAGIKQMLKTMRPIDVADATGVPYTTIFAIQRGRIWRGVPDP